MSLRGCFDFVLRAAKEGRWLMAIFGTVRDTDGGVTQAAILEDTV